MYITKILFSKKSMNKVVQESNKKLVIKKKTGKVKEMNDCTLKEKNYFLKSNVKLFISSKYLNNYKGYNIKEFCEQTKLFKLSEFDKLDPYMKSYMYSQFKILEQYHLKVLFIAKNIVYVATITHLLNKSKCLIYEKEDVVLDVLYDFKSKFNLTPLEVLNKDMYNTSYPEKDLMTYEDALKNNKNFVKFLLFHGINKGDVNGHALKKKILSEHVFFEYEKNYSDSCDIEDFD